MSEETNNIIVKENKPITKSPVELLGVKISKNVQRFKRKKESW